MINQFTVQNFKSIRDSATLDMQALPALPHEDSLLRGIHGDFYLPVAVIYGPNAGGKTNSIDAIRTMRKILLNAKVTLKDNNLTIGEESNHISVSPFAFSETASKEPTIFDIYYESLGFSFHYILHISQNAVQHEELSYLTEQEEIISVFERNKERISSGKDIADIPFPGGLSQSLPFLTYLAFIGGENEVVNAAFSWFATSIRVFDLSGDIKHSGMVLSDDEELKGIFINIMQSMDIDVKDYRIVRHNDEKNTFSVFFKHEVGGKDMELKLQDESEGTKKIFAMLFHLVMSLKYGAVLIIDELDAKLHPLLLQYIIKMFTNKEINTNNAQLIFTSHDIVSLKEEIFRRDEIWFAARDASLCTKLYSLSDFKKQEDSGKSADDIAHDYLAGRYGADPYFKKLTNWN